MGRTIVISDSHGHLGPFEAALAHARFDAGADRLITAGDLLDVGEDDVIGRAKALGAEMLVGNHEVAAALGLRIHPQNESSLARGEDITQRILDGSLRLAAESDGWLITHAGVSETLSDVIARNGREPAAIAEALNTAFRREFEAAIGSRPIGWDDLQRYRLLGGQSGPLWFRPLSSDLLPSGLRQMIGHTPPDLVAEEGLRVLRNAQWLLVDAGGHDPSVAAAGRFRYGVVQDGEACVVEG